MNGGNNGRLSAREKRILTALLALLGAALVFLLYAFGVGGGLGRAGRDLEKREETYRRIDAERQKKKEEWLMWQRGRRDLDEVRKARFYQESDGIQAFRLDVQKVLDETGIQAAQFKYDYSEVRGEKVRQVGMSFACVCSYFTLKRLLDAVERFPKFLLLERLDFIRTPDRGETLELSITLTGYYARD